MIKKEDKILVTGAQGGLGVAIIQKLTKDGYKNILQPSKQEVDLLNKSDVLAYMKENSPLAVFHLASLVYGLKGNIDNQYRSLEENTRLNANFFSALTNTQYVFFAGTVASYPYPYPSIPLREEDFFMGLPHDGEFGYAMAKRHAYAYLKILQKTQGLHFHYGIFTNLYGENDRFNDNTGHVVPSLVVKAYHAKISGTPLRVWGDGSATRDLLHFKDAAAAAVFCMESHVPQELMNISTGQPVSISKIAHMISDSFGIPDIVFEKDKPVGIKERVVNNSYLEKKGWKIETPLELGIPNLCSWYKENLERVRA